ncbi:NUDIX domain-containing protein [Phycicoccus endophyticus]|uniref:NUDIX domain-containing protein n=1 Tax=Phycicoccus endophyticus TaxID=1690220 RepID=A0A7G9QYS9_9MICO|nr:NUDIX domain-containing protein [Phycicoccus endophyticus]NHI20456.1 NUDIX domain-containing protein [Phycicoccus endophyticus]QNN48504.1 NUDIX domain-containing protein [Phycicoccus endophyticus]GGL30600.1 NUDIX hydrolase [Phycicoccus endophyticus]
MSPGADSGPTFAHLHADARRVLRDWLAPDAAQEALRLAYLDHLAAHPDGVARGGPPAHLTASCLVLDATGTRALLTHHRRAGRWFQLGGHLEPGDGTLWAAAAREAREESGIPGLTPLPDPVQLDRHTLEGDFGRCREHLDVRYAAVAPAGATPRVSEESLEVRWWPVADLPEDTRTELSPLVAAARVALGLL